MVHEIDNFVIALQTQSTLQSNEKEKSLKALKIQMEFTIKAKNIINILKFNPQITILECDFCTHLTKKM